ncbi:MAG: acyltransferase family protein [Agarilytica sp.]
MTQRYHALDSLRGIMMWLGIIVHVSINHMAGESILPWRDTQTGPFADLLVIFIHTFRMPVFFILAGFFGAMLLNKYGAKGMLTNRAKRLALPFFLFWPPLLVISGILVLLFMGKMSTDGTLPDLSIIFEQRRRPLLDTMHLWFLYYLIWFFILSVIAHSITQKMPPEFRKKGVVLFSYLSTHWWGLLVLSLPLAGVGMLYEFGLVTPDGSLIPNIGEAIHNGAFFVFGWFFFLNKDVLVEHFQKYCWGYLASGTLVFFIALIEFGVVAQGKMGGIFDRATIAFTYNFASWLWSLALIGIFLRYFKQRNRVLNYLSDSSYWIYLVHMIGTMSFGILLYDTSLSLLPKMIVNIVLTSVACLISYHFLVRNTSVGQLLNGRKHSKLVKGSHVNTGSRQPHIQPD